MQENYFLSSNNAKITKQEFETHIFLFYNKPILVIKVSLISGREREDGRLVPKKKVC